MTFVYDVWDFYKFMDKVGYQDYSNIVRPPICIGDPNGEHVILSIQASPTHYSDKNPSFTNGVMVWKEWEIGFPSVAIPELTKYAENPNKPTQTVYGWVPTCVIMDIINRYDNKISLATKE